MVSKCEILDLGYNLKEDDSSEDTKSEGKSKVPSYHPEVKLKDTQKHPCTNCAKR